MLKQTEFRQIITSKTIGCISIINSWRVAIESCNSRADEM